MAQRTSTRDERTDISRLLTRAARVQRTTAAELLAEVDLHPGQETLLMELWSEDGRTQAELAEALGVEAPTVTKMLQRMERLGVVSRRPDPTDGRVTRVRLTAKGRRLEDRVQPLLDELEDRALAGLSDRQQSMLRNMLTQVVENLEDT